LVGAGLAVAALGGSCSPTDFITTTAPLSIHPCGVTTESVPVGSNTTTTLTVANPIGAQIAVSSADLDGDAAWVPKGSTLDELEVLEPGATSIQLWYAPTAPGVHSTTLSIEIGDKLLAVRLVGGALYPCARAWPLSVDFGDAASGEALVTIQNCGAALTATLGEPQVDGTAAVGLAGTVATWLLPVAEEEVSLTYQATGNCEEGWLSIPVDSATGSIEIEVRGGMPAAHRSELQRHGRRWLLDRGRRLRRPRRLDVSRSDRDNQRARRRLRRTRRRRLLCV
jgi:hypothetical protein